VPHVPDGDRAALPFLASHRLDVVRFEGATRSSWLAAQLDCPELRCLIAEVDRGSTGSRADEACSWRWKKSERRIGILTRHATSLLGRGGVGGPYYSALADPLSPAEIVRFAFDAGLASTGRAREVSFWKDYGIEGGIARPASRGLGHAGFVSLAPDFEGLN
jgi:hypothetical protein